MNQKDKKQMKFNAYGAPEFIDKQLSIYCKLSPIDYGDPATFVNAFPFLLKDMMRSYSAIAKLYDRLNTARMEGRVFEGYSDLMTNGYIVHNLVERMDKESAKVAQKDRDGAFYMHRKLAHEMGEKAAAFMHDATKCMMYLTRHWHRKTDMLAQKASKEFEAFSGYLPPDRKNPRKDY